MCPICKKHEYTVSQAKGYTKDIICECFRCNTIWIYRENEKPDIIYVDGDKNGL